MRRCVVFAVWFAALLSVAAAAEPATNVFESPVPPTGASPLDQLVFAQLAKLNIQPVLCSDAVFVRRVYLDVLGTLPTAKEAWEFIDDPDAKNKRRLLIDRLLERREFADYWAMKWGDVLRIKAEFPVNLWPNAAQAYHRWVKASIAVNKPYDEFVRELLTASGSNFRVGQVNFYRAIQNRTPEGIARAVALTFMGARAELWPSNRFADMTLFFSQIGYKPTGEWKEEHVFWDPLGTSKAPGDIAPGRDAVAAIENPSNRVGAATVPRPANTLPAEAAFPDGTRVRLTANRDPREVFADWLIRPENPWFTRSIANRVWAWLLGRGIIHEPDDIREDNPPANAALLVWLERQLAASHYNLKSFYRLILNSEAYQFSSMPRHTMPEVEANFASYPLRRLDAEVLSDAINKITGSSDLYTSPIPEPFTYIPKGMPAVAIGDGSITSPFLALFGRSARATGMENERNNRPTAAQALYLLNSTDIQRKLEQGPNMQAMLGPNRKALERIGELYLTILSRLPTRDEIQAVESYGRPQAPRQQGKSSQGKKSSDTRSSRSDRDGTPGSGTPDAGSKTGVTGSDAPDSGSRTAVTQQVMVKRFDDWIDIAWALINSEEFLYKH